MSEARRFFRYVLPGLVSILELGIALWLCEPRLLPHLAGVEGVDALGIIGGVFLASGALGYVFAMVYHGLYWTPPFVTLAVDYRRLVARISAAAPAMVRQRPQRRCRVPRIRPGEPGALANLVVRRVLSWTTRRLRERELKRRAWVRVTAWWHSAHYPSVTHATARAESLADIVHGLGASLVGSTLAFVVWMGLVLRVSTAEAVSWTVAAWVTFLVFQTVNYLHAHRTHADVVEAAALGALASPSGSRGTGSGSDKDQGDST